MSTPASLRIDRYIETALDRAFEQIDRYQRDGYCTEEDVAEALYMGWGDAVADGWREYIGAES